jgi:hypothetical protein
MSELPQVGKKYQHKKWGEVLVTDIRKRGRGYQVWSTSKDGAGFDVQGTDRLKDFQKATAP